MRYEIRHNRYWCAFLVLLGAAAFSALVVGWQVDGELPGPWPWVVGAGGLILAGIGVNSWLLPAIVLVGTELRVRNGLGITVRKYQLDPRSLSVESTRGIYRLMHHDRRVCELAKFMLHKRDMMLLETHLHADVFE